MSSQVTSDKKRCSRCKELKSREDFHKNRTKKDGRTGECKDCMQIRNKQYYKKKQEEILKQKRQYYEENREEKLRYQLQRYQEYKEKILEANSKWRKEHREEVLEQQRNYRLRPEIKARDNENKKRISKERFKTDPSYIFSRFCRRQVHRLLDFKSKNFKSEEYLGCTWEEGIQYIESLWDGGMTWENRGKGKGCWEIHHIIPLHTFDPNDPESVFKACHYTNLVPLWYEEHRRIHGCSRIT